MSVAVLIKTTHGREEALRTCLRSVRARLGEQGISHRLYVADDGPVSQSRRTFYDRLMGEGHLIREYGERVGVSQARNDLLSRLEDEQFVLRVDDDFELTEETDVAAMRSILQRVPSLGVIGDLERQIGPGKGVFSGNISDAQGYFERRGDVLVKRLLPPEEFEYERAGSHRYARCDFIRNFLLIRREVLNDVRWDERLTFAGEHADFLLQVGASRWEVAFTPDSVHRHRDDLGEDRPVLSFKREREGTEEADRVLRDKWGIERTVVRRTGTGILRAALVKVQRLLRGLTGTSL